MADETIVDAEGLRTFCTGALTALGLGRARATAMADVLVRTDMRGVRTHGVWLLPAYANQVRKGAADPAAQTERISESGGTVLLDAHGGLGMVTAVEAAQVAIEKARAAGVAAVGVRGANHFGAAGHYALLCADAGMAAIVMANANPVMQAYGASGRVLSNGPTAYGAPRGDAPPFVLDMAMSVSAAQRIARAASVGAAIPEGWLADAEGRPTTDPSEWFRGGALMPLGGHKGYGLALVVEILAGLLTGANLTSDVATLLRDPDTTQGLGYMMIALDVTAFLPMDEFVSRFTVLAERLTGAPKAPGIDRIWLPGEMEHESEERAREHGLALDAPTWEGLRQLAGELQLMEALEGARRDRVAGGLTR